MRLLLILAVLALLGACAPRVTAPAAPSDRPATVAIMGQSRLTGPQLASWFNRREPKPPGPYAATVPVEALAAYFVEEGSDEGVTGDIAFIQSIVETGWFRFSGVVPASANNFAGIGAVDSNPGAFAVFPDARTGVRAQIQHLRAYADPAALTCTAPPLHHPCVDPRFHLVSPKGKAPLWNQLGNGNWATANGYGERILALYLEAVTGYSSASTRARNRASGPAPRNGGWS